MEESRARSRAVGKHRPVGRGLKSGYPSVSAVRVQFFRMLLALRVGRGFTSSASYLISTDPAPAEDKVLVQSSGVQLKRRGRPFHKAIPHGLFMTCGGLARMALI